MKKPLAWWQWFGIIAASGAALGAMTTGIVMAAKWITLPATVEAAVQKNTDQDAQLKSLATIADQNQKMLDRLIPQAQATAMMRATPEAVPERTWDAYTGQWWCCWPERGDCDQTWAGWWTDKTCAPP